MVGSIGWWLLMKNHKWYVRHINTLWISFNLLATIVCSVLVVHWYSTANIALTIIMAIDGLLCIYHIIHQCIELEDKAYLYDQSRCVKN